MRTVIAASLIGLLSGCAGNPASLAKYGDVQLEGNNIKSVSFTFDTPAPPSGLNRCVATVVRNGPVVMTQSGGYVGAYTGNYYATSSNTVIGGDQVIRYVSPDGAEVVATGETRYMHAMTERTIKFTLTAKENAGARVYQYTTIEGAGTQNGYGYHKIHTMPGGGAGNALQALKKLTADIDSCL